VSERPSVRQGMADVARAVVVRLARPGWWRTWPGLPLPTDDLWRMRMLMAYGGDGSGRPDPGDVVAYLEWCASSPSWRRR